MPLPARLALALTISTLCAGLSAAPVGNGSALSELNAIQVLSETSAPQAIVRLEALQKSLPANAPYALRRDVLRTEVWLREDLGQLEAATAVQRKILALARANNDQESVVLASLGEVKRLLDLSRAPEAQAELDRIQKLMPEKPSAGVRAMIAAYQGDIHNSRSKYDKALAAYLEATSLEEGLPFTVERRAYLQASVARVYINIDNPGKALETTQRALADLTAPPRTRGELQFTQAMALMRLERPVEAIGAFRRALETAERGGLTGLEAAVRGNIADYYLRQHDYVTAEREARLALEASNKVKDENLIMMAKANIGFGLLGQGRFDEGMPYVDGVTAALRKVEAWADVEAMLDEKSRMLEGARMYKDALATVREQQKLQQSSARIARDRAIAALQEEYDANQRTRQIGYLNRENQIKEAELSSRRTAQLVTTFAAILTVLAGAVVFVLYRRARSAAARLQQLNTQLEFHSMRDALTGLHNRRSFLEKMGARAAMAEAERRKPTPDEVDCFVLMDIDHFKHINDRWGHGVGDAVLVEVARRLSLAVRESDMVLRWGGEEFLIYAPGTNPAYIAELVGRVLLAIGSSPVDAGNCSVPVTLTAGVVSLPGGGVQQGGADWQRAIRLADWALYQGKANGRNQARIIARMAAPMDTVLAAIDGQAPGTPPADLVELASVPGPVQKTA